MCCNFSGHGSVDGKCLVFNPEGCAVELENVIKVFIFVSFLKRLLSSFEVYFFSTIDSEIRASRNTSIQLYESATIARCSSYEELSSYEFSTEDWHPKFIS